jgi:hypothetical protein
MKKTGYIVLAIAFAILLGACSPKVPVKCGDSILEVSVDKVEEYKKACSTETEPVAQQPACEPAVVAESVVNEPEKVIIATSTCSYDYSVMPTGLDEEGNPLADHGISYTGDIIGPALVQLNSKTVVSVFPGEVYKVPSGDILTWKYIGNDDCLLSQYQWFPGKNIIRIAN